MRRVAAIILGVLLLTVCLFQVAELASTTVKSKRGPSVVVKRPDYLKNVVGAKSAGRVLNSECWDACYLTHHCKPDDDECWKQCNCQWSCWDSCFVRRRCADNDDACWSKCDCTPPANCWHECFHQYGCKDEDTECWKQCNCGDDHPLPTRSFWDELTETEFDSMEAMDYVQEELQYELDLPPRVSFILSIITAASLLSGGLAYFVHRVVPRIRDRMRPKQNKE